MGTKATRNRKCNRLCVKSVFFPVLDFKLFSRFHKQVLRSGKQHIEREMEGRRKLAEKEGGINSNHLRNLSFSVPTLSPVYHLHERDFFPKPCTVMVKMPRISPLMDELLINIWSNASFPPSRLSSPFLRLVLLVQLSSTGKIANDRPRWLQSFATDEVKKKHKSWLFSHANSFPPPLKKNRCGLADASWLCRRIKIKQGCYSFF